MKIIRHDTDRTHTVEGRLSLVIAAGNDRILHMESSTGAAHYVVRLSADELDRLKTPDRKAKP